MNWPSKKVRETFVQYFIRNQRLPHVYIPSSSIIPKNDPSLAFVNAGMNQFKDTILGRGRPVNSRVTNSQKCLRINDLSLVGTDSYHHTFFEMLGNWSFSNYYKKEACEMAWDLLTNVYGLDPQRLYVTYFSGGESIPADRETKEIWEDIGVTPSRILPFGKDNFWSMAHIGPCGPSTEIHYDHRGTYNDPTKVNQDIGSVVEIWNLVFMQYNRTEKGTLERLPLSHVVDTGAGLERLTAVMNGKVSNYDTDLFYPIFDSIHHLTGTTNYGFSFKSELDLSYRIFADHMRAVTVALSDGILPQTNVKIRRLVHRSLSLTESHFLPKVSSEGEVVEFLSEIVESISNSLSTTYPEIEQMKDETVEILEHEVHRYISSRRARTLTHEILPKLLVVDYPQLSRIKNSDIVELKNKGIVDGVTAFKWYDSYGVPEEAVEEFCKSLSLKFDKEGYRAEMSRVKKVFRDEIAKNVMNSEENSFIRKVESLLSLYNPAASGGIFVASLDELGDSPVEIQWVFDQDGDPVEEFSPENTSYWAVLTKTPFYPGTESVVSDAGSFEIENWRVGVRDVKQLPSGWILHQITNVPEIGFRRRAEVLSFSIDEERRCGRRVSVELMFRLKEWLKRNYSVVRFHSQFSSSSDMRLTLSLLHGELNSTALRKYEDECRKSGLPVVLTKRIWKMNGTYELVFSTGEGANECISHGIEVGNLIGSLRQVLSSPTIDYIKLRDTIKEHVDELNDLLHHSPISLPYDTHCKAEKIVGEAERLIEKNEILFETLRIAGELKKISERSPSYAVETVESGVEFYSLIKFTKLFTNKPVLIFIQSPDGHVQGRCSIPQEMISDNFCAEEWMKVVVDELGGGSYSAPKGQDPKLVVNLKRMRVINVKDKLKIGLEKGREYVTRKILLLESKKSQDFHFINSK